MKKLLLLFAILPFMISCNYQNDKLVNRNNTIDTVGKINIETMNIEKFNIMGFYKKFDYKDAKLISKSDSVFDYTKFRFYDKDNFGLPYNLDKVNPDYYFPNYSYYKEDVTTDDLNINLNDTTSIPEKKFPAIAYFKNIEFDYVSFTTKKNDTKPLAFLFSTIRSTDSLNFDNKLEGIEEKYGSPMSRLRVSNGYHTVIKSNTWLINNKYYQFYVINDESYGERINLLIIDKKDIDIFNKEENLRFPIIHLNEKKLKEIHEH